MYFPEINNRVNNEEIIVLNWDDKQTVDFALCDFSIFRE